MLSDMQLQKKREHKYLISNRRFSSRADMHDKPRVYTIRDVEQRVPTFLKPPPKSMWQRFKGVFGQKAI